MAKKLKPSTVAFGLAGAFVLLALARKAQAERALATASAPEQLQAALPGETAEQYNDRMAAVELASGLPMPRIEGLSGGGLYGARDWARTGGEWYRY
jgi:hypothetical protein